MKLGVFIYNGDGELLDNNVEYTIFETENTIEAYPEGSGEPVEMNKGTFVSLLNGKLEQVKGSTPMR